MIESDVVIIGGGPAGVSAALQLRKLGIRRVIILEREREAGGIPRHCAHPPYGFWEFGRIMTGPAYARRLVCLAQKAGVEIRLLTTVVNLLPEGVLEIATPDGRRQLRSQRVLIATGVRETPRSVSLISGERPIGVINTGTLQAYIHLHGRLPFKRPVIVGTELVSLSAVIDCRSHGIRPVAIVEQNIRPTARWPLFLFPRLLGIPMHLNSEIVDIKGSSRVTSVIIRELRNGALQDYACDGVLLTGKFVPEASLIRASHLALDSCSQGPSIDQFGRCSDPSYFAAGNVIRPVETAGWCYREGQRIAHYVAKDLLGNLPTARHETKICCGPGVKFVVPQRLDLKAAISGAKHLEIRAISAINGKLRVFADEGLIYERKISALPERRILVPLHVLTAQIEARRFMVEISHN